MKEYVLVEYINKKFDPALCARCNRLAKEAFLRFVLAWGGRYVFKVGIWDQPEAYKSHDVIVFNVESGQEELFELELRLIWLRHGLFMSYPTIHIPARKINNRSRYYVSFNKHLDTAIMIDLSVILPLEQHTDLVPKVRMVNLPAEDPRTSEFLNEDFIDVPLTFAILLKKNANGNWIDCGNLFDNQFAWEKQGNCWDSTSPQE